MDATPGALLPIAIFIASSLAALVLHEAAHIAVARIAGVRVKRIGISWRGPYIVREPGEPRANIRIALAGPVTNVVLGMLFLTAAPTFAQINLVLGLSNLLPISGSDGSHVWAALRQLKTAPSVAVPFRAASQLDKLPI